MNFSLLGVGLLGSAIAERLLLQQGCSLRGYDPDPEARARAPHGIHWAESEVEAANGADCLILCLPTSEVSARLAPGLFPLLPRGALILDCTTGDPEQMAALGRLAAEHGCRYLDTTIGGSSAVVRAGQGLVMAGAPSSEDFQVALPVLRAITSHRVVHAGPPGYGARMKLVLNLALGLHRAVLAEALHFGEALGLDAQAVLAVLRDGPAYSKVMDSKGDRMLQERYDPPDARLAQHHKDVRLMLESAQRADVALPLTEVHERLLEEAERRGFAAADNAAIREAYRVGGQGE